MENLGKYQVLQKLGKGSTSEVYLAVDPFNNRQVAIKRLLLNDTSSDAGLQLRQLFLNEASLAGKLAHPYIASIYDAVLSNGENYLVMEYVPGGTLEQYCKVDNLLPLEKSIEVVFKCCKALDYASQNGIIHRDIKPENVLVVQGTDIRISDFGAAQIKSGSHCHAGNSSGVGSIAYMSPQHLLGENLNPQADIYSLGILFYRLLTGSLPFSASDESGLAYQVVNVTPSPPSAYRVDIPGIIDEIVMQAISKTLDGRFLNWGQFESKLLSAIDHLPKSKSSLSEVDKFNTLKKLDFFNAFGEIELWEVVHFSKWAYYPEGTTVIHEGDETDSFFILTNGESEVRKYGRKISSIKSGECIGEMSHIRKDARRRSASVIAKTDIGLIEIHEDNLSNASDACQYQFAKSFLAILASRLAEAREEQAQFFDKGRAKLSVRGREPKSVEPDPHPEVAQNLLQRRLIIAIGVSLLLLVLFYKLIIQ